jgi:protein-disulfide isomerase
MTRKRMYLVAAALGLAAVAVLVGASLVSGKSSSAPTSLTTVAMGSQTAALLAGIPQHGDTLGSPRAPLTLVEYADMQCPYCGEFARGTLPTLIRSYVRTGKVKLVFRGLEFVGADSDVALRAVYAAGRQDKLWSYGGLMFENQGTENTGWVTEDLVKSLAVAVPGLDTAKLLSDRSSAGVSDAIAASGQHGQMDGVAHTPWFELGKTGQGTQALSLSSLDAPSFTAAFDRLLNS